MEAQFHKSTDGKIKWVGTGFGFIVPTEGSEHILLEISELDHILLKKKYDVDIINGLLVLSKGTSAIDFEKLQINIKNNFTYQKIAEISLIKEGKLISNKNADLTEENTKIEELKNDLVL